MVYPFSRPVVTTRCSNVGKYGEACRIAETSEDFIAAVEQVLRGESVPDPGLGMAIARARTWDRQVQDLLPWVAEGWNGRR